MTPPKTQTPVPKRTCIGCRAVGPATELAHLRIDDNSVVVGKGPGRGASLHSSRDCLDLAIKKRAFGRAFREPSIVVDQDLLARDLGV